MANIKFTYAAVTLLSLTTVANSISASNTFTNLTQKSYNSLNI